MAGNDTRREGPGGLSVSRVLVRTVVIVTVLSLSGVIVPALFALGRAEQAPPVEITGILRLVGNEPFPQLIISSGDGQDYYLPDPRDPLFRDLVGQEITVVAMVQDEEQRTPDGSFSTTRLLLVEPQLLSQRR